MQIKGVFSKAELKPQLLGLSAMNWTTPVDSSTRIQMWASHQGQMLVLKHGEIRHTQSLVEQEFAGSTVMTTTPPQRCEVIRVIKRYRRTIGADSINHSPETIIVYDNIDTREVGMISLVDYCCRHQHFGFEFVNNDKVLSSIRAGSVLEPDTVLQHSPSIDGYGNYKYGVNAEVFAGSFSAGIEDGAGVNEDFLPKLTSKGYERVSFSFGKRHFPLEAYHDPSRPDYYKAIPDIGDFIRPDGLIVALREHNPILAPIRMTKEALRRVDYTFDQRIYTSPIARPNARVIDVIVTRNKHEKYSPTPVGMEVQFKKYEAAASAFYGEILEVYNTLVKQRGAALKLSGPLHRLIVRALGDSGFTPGDARGNGRERVTSTYRGAPQDDWNVTIVYEYDVLATIGSKVTDCHGGKSVITSIIPAARMFRDKHGNVADIAIDGDSKYKRMNLGGPVEQYINASWRDQIQRYSLIRYGLHGAPGLTVESVANHIRNSDPALLDECFARLVDFYRCVNPEQAEAVLCEDDPTYRCDPVTHLADVMVNGVYIGRMTDNPKILIQVIRDLRDRYPALKSNIFYVDSQGEPQMTYRHGIIGKVYYIVLEKTGGNYSGVASAKQSHFGSPAKLTENDKRSAPARQQPVKLTGEAENRLFAATMNPDVVADMHDRSNNPNAHAAIYRTVITHPTPTNISVALSRDEIPLGYDRPSMYINNVVNCFGAEFFKK